MTPQPEEVFSAKDARGVNTLSSAPLVGEKDGR